jgi:2-aminoadipate transaminase
VRATFAEVALFTMDHFWHGGCMLVKHPAVPVGDPIRLATAATRVGSSAIRDLLEITERPEVISLAGGLPCPDAFPVEAIAAATDAVLTTHAASALQYAPTGGHPPLRAWAAAQHGADAEQAVITHGSQQALELVTRATVEPGQAIALADPGYVGALQAFRLTGAQLVGIARDDDGMRVDELEARLRDGFRPVLVYVVSNFDNPTGATLSDERRHRLATLADHYGFLIVDDDPYGSLRWGGPPVSAMATLSDRVVQLGTTSKTLCPGLRVGWAIAPVAVTRAVIVLKQAADLQTGTFTQRIAHHVLTQPAFLPGHLAGLRRRYAQQCEALATALRVELGERISFDAPSGGMFLWARLHGSDTRQLLATAVAHGVAFVPGAEFGVDANHNSGAHVDSLRLSFATAAPDELRAAARRLALAADSSGG